MAHGHSHAHDHQHHHHHGSGNVGTAFFLNLGFTIIEIIGGLLTNSVAILSDALHDFGDSLSLGLAWYFEKLSKKGRTPQFTFGYKRFNTLGALINGIVLVVGSIIILMEAIPRLFNPEETHAPGMIVLAVLGVLVNGLAAWRLGGGQGLNQEMMSLHLLEDVLGWVAVLIGAVVMYFFDLPWIDPALSIAITLFVLYNVVRRLIRAGKIILQATPEDVDIDHIRQDLSGIAEIRDVHHTHLWTLDGEYNVLTIHVKTDGDRPVRELQPIKQEIRHRLEHLNVEHVTIEFEAVEEACEREGEL